MSILDGGFLIGGETPMPTPALPTSVPIDNSGTLPVMTLPEDYAEYNLLGFTYIDGDAILPYALDLNYIKGHEMLTIAPDYSASPIQWQGVARTLTGVQDAAFHDAFIYRG